MKANIPSKIKNHQVVARNSATHRAWALEAASLAGQVLPIFEQEHPDDNRPRQAIEAIRDWAQGGIMKSDLPLMTFESGRELRAWLVKNHATSSGIWLQIYKKNSGVESVTFEEVLDEGLCFGWSESKRIKGDEKSYLQRFTPRRKKGTTSKRNLKHVERLIEEKRMTSAGLNALGIEEKSQ
jgi:hypothetical protein